MPKSGITVGGEINPPEAARGKGQGCWRWRRICMTQALRGTLGGRLQEEGRDSDQGASRGGLLLGERVCNPSVGPRRFPWGSQNPLVRRCGRGVTIPLGQVARQFTARRGVWPRSLRGLKGLRLRGFWGWSPWVGAHPRLPRARILPGPRPETGSPKLAPRLLPASRVSAPLSPLGPRLCH